MKVVAGKYKGRVLLENKFEHIRPTADMVKQALFNKLAFVIEDAVVLDLFCGTGAIGIEALSRGAKEVIFVDKDSRSIAQTKANLKKINIDAKIMHFGYLDALEILKEKKFDIIFLDPPYKSGFYTKALQKIAQLNMLSEDGIIVCEHAKDEKIDFEPFEIQTQKKYGSKMLTFLIKHE